MKTSVKLLGAVLAMTVASAPAFAKVWDFSFTDSIGDSAVGQLITGYTGPVYTVTGISGTINGLAITGLSPYAAADQQLFTASPYADFSGISFTAQNGVDYNWSNYGSALGGIANSVSDPGGYGSYQAVITSSSVSAVPELSTWVMLLTGFAGLGFAGYRRTKNEGAAHTA